MRKLLLQLLIGITIISPAAIAAAHPHIFITPRAHFAFHKTTFSFFSVRWYFDDMSTIEFVGSQSINATFTLDTFQQKEILAMEGFPRPAQLSKYFRVKIDNAPVNVLPPADISLAVDNGRLVYAFTIGVYRPISKNAAICFHDNSNFIAYETGKGFFTTSHTNQQLPFMRILTEQSAAWINITLAS